MTKLSPVLLLIMIITSCKKDVKVSDVFMNFNIKNKTLLADGTSGTTVTVELPIESDPSKRGVIFSAANGSIVGAQQGKLLVKAEFVDGKLIAKANFRASFKPGTAYVTIVPENQSPYEDYSLKDSLTLNPSLPGKIRIEFSAPAVRVNYQSEIFLRAVVSGSDDHNVSEGVEVRYETYFAPAGPFFDARYRNLQTATSDSSSVSTFLSVGNQPVNADFYVRATVWQGGAPSAISDKILLTIIN